MKFVTLGPDGTCHLNATRHYVNHFGIEGAEYLLIEDFLEGLELVHEGKADYLVQNSAHLDVHHVTEKYHREIVVMDNFIYPTQEMALIEFADVENPQSVGLVSATEGYLDGIHYETKVYGPSKLRIAERLFKREFDAAVVYMYHYTDNPGMFRLRRYIGSVLTSWLVYGADRTFNGEIMSALPKDYFRKAVGVE